MNTRQPLTHSKAQAEVARMPVALQQLCNDLKALEQMDSIQATLQRDVRQKLDELRKETPA